MWFYSLPILNTVYIIVSYQIFKKQYEYNGTDWGTSFYKLVVVYTSHWNEF